MEALFAVGTFWFWALIVFEASLIMTFTKLEKGISLFLSLFCFLGIIQFWSHIDVLGWISNNPFLSLGIFVAYFVVGVLWGIVRWRLALLERIQEHDELFLKFLSQNNLPLDTVDLPAEFKERWKSVVNRTMDFNGQTIVDTPKANLNKSRIIIWMTFWVFSVILYLFSDLVYQVYSAIYGRIAGFLQRIADNVYSSRDLKKNIQP